MATPNLHLPEISQSQASKEITHNQALRIIDVLLPVPLVQDKDLSAPPAPVAGRLYIVAANASGAWSGQAHTLAYSDGAAWYFIAPKTGWPAYVMDEAKTYRFNGASWALAHPGDVQGASTSVDKAWPRFSGMTGKQLQPGRWVEADNGEVAAGGTLNMLDQGLLRPVLKDYAEEAFDLGTMAGDVFVDFEQGNFQYGTLIGDVRLAILNPPSSGKIGTMRVELNQDAAGNHQVMFSSAFQFTQGVPPLLSVDAGAKDVLTFYTRDGGATYQLSGCSLNIK